MFIGFIIFIVILLVIVAVMATGNGVNSNGASQTKASKVFTELGNLSQLIAFYKTTTSNNDYTGLGTAATDGKLPGSGGMATLVTNGVLSTADMNTSVPNVQKITVNTINVGNVVANGTITPQTAGLTGAIAPLTTTAYKVKAIPNIYIDVASGFVGISANPAFYNMIIMQDTTTSMDASLAAAVAATYKKFSLNCGTTTIGCGVLLSPEAAAGTATMGAIFGLQ